MLYSDSPRVHYDKAQLAEVICQLRFPSILAISAREPADFQDAIRSMFPRYAARQEQPRSQDYRPWYPCCQAGAGPAHYQLQLYFR